MTTKLIDEMRTEEFRALVQLSARYWQGTESQRAAKKALLADRAIDGAPKATIRADIYEMIEELPGDLRNVLEKLIARRMDAVSAGNVEAGRFPRQKRNEGSARKTEHVATLAEASASKQSWDAYLAQDTKAVQIQVVIVCGVVCVIALVAVPVVRCVKKWINGKEVEVCEEVMVEQEQEVCEEVCKEVVQETGEVDLQDTTEVQLKP